MSFLSVALILFLIMDPVGSLNSYLHMVEKISPQRRRWVALREMLIALGTMLIFALLGESIFMQLHLSHASLNISAGIILFLIAIKILFLYPTSLRANLPQEEPFIIPLAIPLIAGPSLLATIMLYSLLIESPWAVMGAITIAWAAASLILLGAAPIKRLLGNNGLIACERLMGMLLIILGVQRILAGVELFSKQYLSSS